MASSNSARRIVKLDYVRQNNIVLVDLNNNLSGDVFEKEYKKAAKIIGSIIDATAKKTQLDDPHCQSCKTRGCNSCKYRDRRGCDGSDRQKYSLSEFQTAVPFIGDRGTGKSSVMCSVLESLRCYRGGNESAALYLGEKKDDVRFITFDMIDANTLKSSENIMEIILSRMLSYLEAIEPEGDFRELYRMINELHEDLGLVYWKDTDKREGYGLAALQRVADSQKTIINFRKLVELFTWEVSLSQFGGRPCYLVIALDDIDMYQGSKGGMNDSHFALLEHIYNHMRIPGLIVLMTYNEHILKRKCNDHFSKIYNGNRASNDKSQTRRENIVALTAQFMSKLFPQERRIYLPNYLLVSLENRPNLFVNPTLNGDSETAKELSRIFPTNQDLPVKDFMLRLIAHKTGVYFDAAGTKKHFFEPRNLRELGELFQVICSMAIVPQEETKQETVREQNRQELLEYLYNQFALRHLSSDEYRRFTRLAVLPLDRQGRTMVDQIREHRLALNLPADDLGFLDRTKRDRWKYSYGELLHNIYFATRMPSFSGSNQTFYSKEFIHCILGSHSVIMNQNMIKTDCEVVTENTKKAVAEQAKLIRSVMGSSIAGRWANEMLPDFFYEGGSKAIAAGSISIPIRHFFDWELQDKVQDAILDLFLTSAITKNNSRKKKVRKDTEAVLSQYMEAFAVIGMFFTGFPKNGLKIEIDCGLNVEKQPTFYLRSKSDDHICFNVMNFVINLYNADVDDADRNDKGYLPFIRSKLRKLGDEIVKQLSRDLEKEIANAGNRARARADEFLAENDYLPKDTPLEELNSPKVKSELQLIHNAEAWLPITYGHQFDAKIFMKFWTQIADQVCDKFQSDIETWQTAYPQFPMVLPVQNFDMMYNIIKRLANVYYHDIPEDVPLEEVYDYFSHLYESVVEELKKQDDAYHLTEGSSFAKAFQDSVFFKAFNAPQETRNPYIKDILIDMMKKALPAQHARTHSGGL